MKIQILSFLKKIGLLSKSKIHKYPADFSRLLDKKLSGLEKLLGYKIKDPTFYVKALTHRSYSEFTDYNLRSNERLEFLGDSVLSIIIAEFLFKNFPNENEGFLTKTRAKLVNRGALATAAKKINLLDLMLVSESFLTMPDGAGTIVSNAIESLIGAIYLESGLGAARDFVEKKIIIPSMEEGLFLIDKNYKSKLLEFTQANKLDAPVYKIINEEGPHHAKTFTINVSIEKIGYGTGIGKNKKTAEQNAAQDALIKIGEIQR